MDKEKSLVLVIAKGKKPKKKYEKIYIWSDKHKYWILEERLVKDKKKKDK